MSAAIFWEDYRITSYLVNLRQRAGLYGTLNLIQDVGWQHAIHLGFDLAGQGLLWVFTRQHLRMDRWPAWNEVVTLRTWLRPFATSPFVFRDYELLVGSEKVGQCTSSFTVIDAKTRKLAVPDWSAYQGIGRSSGAFTLEPVKIPLQSSLRDLAEFEVRNSDLDLNQHVNNTRYSQWILDALPLPLLTTAELREFEINFLAETRKGDLITVQEAETAPGAPVQFQGFRRADGKTVFSARLTIAESSGG